MMGWKSLAAAAVLAIATGVTGASAATVQNCGNKSFSLTQDGMDLSAAICASGNTTGNGSAIEADGWTSGGELKVNGTNGTLTVGTNTWSMTNAGGYPKLGISVKEGNGFAFYVLDLTKALTGTWFTGKDGVANTAGFSHINAWYKGTPDNGDPDVVPLPATAWLMLAAFGGLAAARRRKA